MKYCIILFCVIFMHFPLTCVISVCPLQIDFVLGISLKESRGKHLQSNSLVLGKQP